MVARTGSLDISSTRPVETTMLSNYLTAIAERTLRGQATSLVEVGVAAILAASDLARSVT